MLSKRTLTSALQQLEDVGVVQTLSTGEIRLCNGADPGEYGNEISQKQHGLKEVRRERLEAMRSYADTTACRRELLLRYFGDNYAGPCVACDNCQAAAPPSESTEACGGTRREVD
jgi:ATP-dependent DNA helicase RecQ